MAARPEESVHRRLELCRAGFTYDPQHALWHRGHVWLSDEVIDTLEPWGQYVTRWRATRARHEAMVWLLAHRPANRPF